MITQSDADFSDRLRANDSRAWALAYDSLYRRTKRAIAGVLYSLDDHDVENIAADILSEFVHVLLEKTNEKLNDARSFDDLLNMLARIAKLRTIDYLRRVGIRPKFAGVDAGDLETLQNSGVADEGRHSQGGVPIEEIMDCVERLPDSLKNLWKPRLEEDRSVKEIASALRINYNTACGLFAEGRKALKQCLQAKGYSI